MSRKGKRRKTGWIALILCLVMAVGIIPQTPVTAMADDKQGTSIAQEAIKAMSKILGSAEGSTNGVTSTDRNLVIIGDSRTVGMYGAVTGDTDIPNTAALIKTDDSGTTWSCRVGMGYYWMRDTGVPNAEAMLDENSDVVITMGINDYLSPGIIGQYASYINRKAKEWKGQGVRTFFCSIMPIKGDNSAVEKANEKIRGSLSGDVTYIDTYSAMKDSVKYTDTLHYTAETCKDWYNQIVSLTSGGSGTSGTSESSGSSGSSGNSGAPTYMDMAVGNASSAADISVDEFINALKKVTDYVSAHQYRYGNSSSKPPCTDGLISCDRLVSSALYALGMTDQGAGGLSLGNASLKNFLDKKGFVKSYNMKDIRRGSILFVRHSGYADANMPDGYGHVFVVESFDPKTYGTKRYDCGAESWIRAGGQPVSVSSWNYRKGDDNENTHNIMIYNLPASSGGSKSSGSDILKETNLADIKLEDLECRRLNSNGKEKDPSALKGKKYTDYTDTYTYVGKPEDGGSGETEEAPDFKELSDDDKKGTAVRVTYHVGNSSTTQTYYSGSSTTQYLGKGTDKLAPKGKKIAGWAVRQSNGEDAQGTGNEIAYGTYQELDETAVENMASGNGEGLALYAVLADKDARTKDDTIRVVTEEEYNGDLHDCFPSNPLSVRFAYVTKNGDLKYTDKQDVTSYESRKMLYKTILAMAAVATDNQTNTVDGVSSSSGEGEPSTGDGESSSAEDVESSSGESGEENAKTNEPEAYVKYCTEMAKKAVEGYQGYSVVYTPVLLDKVKGSDYDYTWEEDGVTYRSPGARLSASVTVYVDANLESLCAQDTMGEQWFHDNGMPSITSVFGSIVKFFKGLLFGKEEDKKPVFWTKENRGYAKDYLDLSDDEFEGWFHCSLSSGSGGTMMGTKYLEIMAQMAEGDKYLYGHAGRPASVESKYVDCSSFVARALYVAGVITDPQASWTTFNMGDELKKLGFTEHKYTGMNDLQAGDILVVNDANNNHTETYYGDGKVVGSHTDECAPADQVSIEKFYEDGWQFYYRPPASMLTSIGNGTMTGNTVAEKLWSYFTSCGFSKTATAAIMGNAMQESSMNPTAGSVAYGLFQFEMGTGNANDYYTFAASRGKDIGDVQTQCDFLIKQLPGAFQGYTGNGVYTYSTGAQAWWPEAMTMEEWNALDDVDLQAEIFERVYERASIPNNENRKKYARQFLGQFGS